MSVIIQLDCDVGDDGCYSQRRLSPIGTTPKMINSWASMRRLTENMRRHAISDGWVYTVGNQMVCPSCARSGSSVPVHPTSDEPET